MEMPQTRYTKTADGVHIAYQLFGDGPSDLVVVCPGGMPIDLVWDEPVIAAGMRRLASFSRVIVSDPRGFGSSGLVFLEGLPPLQAWMDDISAAMDAAGSARAELLSWGEGTPFLILFAATYPRRAASLVLVNAYARYGRSAETPWGLPMESFSHYAATIGENWQRPRQ